MTATLNPIQDWNLKKMVGQYTRYTVATKEVVLRGEPPQLMEYGMIKNSISFWTTYFDIEFTSFPEVGLSVFLLWLDDFQRHLLKCNLMIFKDGQPYFPKILRLTELINTQGKIFLEMNKHTVCNYQILKSNWILTF